MALLTVSSRPLAAVLFDSDDALLNYLGAARAALAATCAEPPALPGAAIAALSRHYGKLLEEVPPQLLASRCTVAEAGQLRFEHLLAPDQLLPAQVGVVADCRYGHYPRASG